MKRSLLLVLFAALFIGFFSTAFAQTNVDDTRIFEIRMANQMIRDYWKSLDIYYQIHGKTSVPPEVINEYKRLTKSIDDCSKAIAGRVIRKMGKNDLTPLKSFSDFYKSKQACERQPLYLACTPIIEKVKKDILASNRGSSVLFDSAEQFAAEYFPGYGYGEPGFEYRKGRELTSEFLHAFWQDEEKVIETLQHFEGTIDLKLAAELAALPGIGNFQKIGEPFKMDIGGHIIVVIKVSFDSHTKLTTVAKKKYAATKIWFELLRRKKGMFSDAKWEVTGKTYEMRELFTNEEVISSVKVGK